MRKTFFLLSVLMICPYAAHGQAVSPTIERGFDPAKSYAFQDFDAVNVFNGNLNVNIPLGMRYQVGAGLSYQFLLSYGGHDWEFATYEGPDAWNEACACVPDDYVPYTWAYPTTDDNAGFGWQLHFGRLWRTGAPGCEEGSGSAYQSPDGAMHCFYPTLHRERPSEQADGLAYTRDGSYLRLTYVSPQLATIEFPDGAIHEFTSDDSPKFFGVTRILDRFGNNVTFDYHAGAAGAPPVWHIHDSAGRDHYVYFKETARYHEDYPQYTELPPHYSVSEVRLAAFDGGTATYTLHYWGEADGTWKPILRHPTEGRMYDTDLDFNTVSHPLESPWVNATMLEKVERPDTSTFEFDYHNGDCAMCVRRSGLMTYMKLPTGGALQWSYETLVLPEDERLPWNNLKIPNDGFATVEGVTRRDIFTGPTGSSPRGTLLGARTYQGTVLTGERKVTITDFDGDPAEQHVLQKSDNFFTVCVHDCVAPTYLADYALPFTKNTASPTASSPQRYLSTITYGPGSNWTEVQQKSYVAYEGDGGLATIPRDVRDVNRRMLSQQTDYVGSSQQVTESTVSASSQFDGVGHYRTQTATGFGLAAARTTTTNYNPSSGTYPSTFTMPGRTSAGALTPWILNTYDSVTTSEDDQVRKSEYAFDAATGFLLRKRTNKDQTSGARGPNDLLAVFQPGTYGFTAREEYYGGDASTVPTGSLASLTVPPASARTARIDHTYTSGTDPAVTGSTQHLIVKTQYYTTADQPVGFYASNDVLDANTWLLRTSLDMAALMTTYTYDSSGRLQFSRPAWRGYTEYVYQPATPPAVVVKLHLRDDSAVYKQSRYVFDTFGRLASQFEGMPHLTERERRFTYNSLGWTTSSSQLGDVTALTSTIFDYLGRPTKVVGPSNDVTSWEYVGGSQKKRTSRVWTGTADSSIVVTETYDALGRLLSVAEPSGPTSVTQPLGAAVVTSYAYDVADRLRSVRMAGPSGELQTRIFDYDGRGFLRWESQPESGMSAYTYDGQGNVLTKTQAAANSQFDLRYTYDAARRLTLVEARNPYYDSLHPEDGPEFQPLKEFFFSTTAGRSLGKLGRAARYNYGRFSGDAVFKVEDVYTYGDTAGRLTGRSTTLSKDGEVIQTFDMAQTYDDFDAVSAITYPMCIGCGVPGHDPSRTLVTYSYDAGYLTQVGGGGDITYESNGLRNSIAHVNGISDTITYDKSSRPASIAFGRYDACLKPSFVSQPVSATIPSPGSSTVLSASATGNGTLTYTWYEIGNNAAIGTGPSITVHPSQTTEYFVLAANDCGYTESQTAVVSIGSCTPPSTGTIRAVLQPDRSWILTPSPTVGTNPHYEWRKVSNNAFLLAAETLAVGALSETTTYRLTVTDDCGSGSGDVTIQVAPVITTSALTAAADLTAMRVNVSWPAVSNAASYTVERRAGGDWRSVGTVNTASFVDSTVTSGKTYAYRVYATDASGAKSKYSNSDVATTMSFGAPVSQQQISSVPATDMLNAVNKVREAAGWPALTWSNILSSGAPLPSPGLIVTGEHVTSCRARMNEALQALGVPVRTYTDPDVVLRTVKAVHIREVQERAQ